MYYMRNIKMLPLKGRCQEIPHRFFPTNFQGPIDMHRKDLDFFVVVQFFITSWIYPPDTNLQAVLASDVKKTASIFATLLGKLFFQEKLTEQQINYFTTSGVSSKFGLFNLANLTFSNWCGSPFKDTRYIL